MDKRLFRNEQDKVIAGVSSGVAEYMEVDVTIIRLLFVLSTIFLVGTGVLVYLIMWIVVPANNNPAANFSKFNDFFKNQNTNNPFGATQAPEQGTNPGTSAPQQDWSSSTFGNSSFKTPQDPGYKFVNKSSDTGRTVGGLFLLVIGIYFLMNEFNLIPYWFRIGKLWPLVFVAIGVSFILKSKRKNTWEEWKNRQAEQSSPAEPIKPEPDPQRDTTSTASDVPPVV